MDRVEVASRGAGFAVREPTQSPGPEEWRRWRGIGRRGLRTDHLAVPLTTRRMRLDPWNGRRTLVAAIPIEAAAAGEDRGPLRAGLFGGDPARFEQSLKLYAEVVTWARNRWACGHG